MIRRFLFLVALVLAVPAWAADERAKTDRSTKTHTILGENLTGEIRKIRTNDAGELLFASGAGGLGVVDQGAAGVDPTVRWHMVLRNAAGVEFGLAASPFGVTLFNAAGDAIGTTADPIVTQEKVSTTIVAGVVSCGTTETEIGTASADRLELFGINTSTDVIFVGPTGLTTANGIPLADSFVAADGEAGRFTMDSTQAFFCRVVSGTGELRFVDKKK